MILPILPMKASANGICELQDVSDTSGQLRAPSLEIFRNRRDWDESKSFLLNEAQMYSETEFNMEYVHMFE